jgi:hypothetical protein
MIVYKTELKLLLLISTLKSDPCGVTFEEIDDDDDGLAGNDVRRRASEPAFLGDPIVDEQDHDDDNDNRDRENAAASLKSLRDMLCMHLGTADSQSNDDPDARIGEVDESEEAEAEQLANVVVNVSGPGTCSGSRSSSLQLALTPIREVSDEEDEGTLDICRMIYLKACCVFFLFFCVDYEHDYETISTKSWGDFGVNG